MQNAQGSGIRDEGTARVVVFSELYWPEDTSTGHFLTGIAEGLAQDRPVAVFCAQPTYSKRGARAPRRERRHGVDITRVSSTTLSHKTPVGRALNLMTVASALFLRALLELRRGDRVLVVTNPPVLPYLVLLAARLRGAATAVLVHDVYPEVLEATGLLGAGGMLPRVLRGLARWLYRHAARIVVLGRDMEALVASYLTGDASRIAIIPNWGDCDTVRPSPRGESALLRQLRLEHKFVVQWMGNMGRTHALAALLRAAAALRERPQVHWLFIGWGSRRAWLEKAIAEHALDNVTLLPPCERESLSDCLAACDLAVIAFLPGMAGVSVPSRVYNVLAAGRPVLAVADAHSELCRVVREERVGWAVTPESVDSIVQAVVSAVDDPETRAGMRARARAAAEARYSREVVVGAWKELFAEEWRP